MNLDNLKIQLPDEVLYGCILGFTSMKTQRILKCNAKNGKKDNTHIRVRGMFDSMRVSHNSTTLRYFSKNLVYSNGISEVYVRREGKYYWQTKNLSKVKIMCAATTKKGLRCANPCRRYYDGRNSKTCVLHYLDEENIPLIYPPTFKL